MNRRKDQRTPGQRLTQLRSSGAAGTHRDKRVRRRRTRKASREHALQEQARSHGNVSC